MPISKYFGGGGEKVMANMKGEYGEKEGERIFYATANKQKGKKKHSNHSLQGIKRALANRPERGESKAHERGESKAFERTED